METTGSLSGSSPSLGSRTETHESEAQISTPLLLSMTSIEEEVAGEGETRFSPRFSDIANSWDDSLLDHVDATALLFDLDAFERLPSPAAPRLPQARLDVDASPAPLQLTMAGGASSRQLSCSSTQVAVSSSSQVIASMARKAKSPVTETPALTGRKRVKQKDEIALLREEVPRLQEQLDHLIAYWKHKSLTLMAQSSHSSSSSHAGHDGDCMIAGCVEPKWRTIAARRRDELKDSEMHNERLNAQVQLHKRALQHIRKLLGKRVVSATVSHT